jgi:hypothetical protein
MRCDEARKRLNDAFDAGRTIADDVPLAAHIRQCADCAALADRLLSFRDDLAAAGVDDLDGGRSFEQTRRQVESQASRGAVRHAKETSIMARLQSSLTPPRVGIGVAAVAALLVLALLVPFKFQDNTLGYEVAFAGVDRGIAMDTERIDQFLAQLGLENAVVDVGDCEQTCKVKISKLESADAAYLVYTAFNDFLTIEIKADVMELQQSEDGEIVEIHVRNADLENMSFLTKDSAHALILKSCGPDFDPGRMIWFQVDSCSDSSLADIGIVNIQGRQFDFLSQDCADLTEEQIEELRAAGVTVEKIESENGSPQMLFLKKGDCESTVVVDTAGEGAARIDGTLPEGFELDQNYPNPFNPSTTIDFTIPEPVKVTLEVYNVNGQRVATLVDGWLDSGHHSVEWNAVDDEGSSVATGVYLYRLTAGDVVATKKMTLVK